MAAKAKKANGKSRPKAWRSERYEGALALARECGLMEGPRTTTVRGRMPDALVREAKLRTGVRSDTSLLELALAHLVMEDDYAEWLMHQRGTIPKDMDLEFF